MLPDSVNVLSFLAEILTALSGNLKSLRGTPKQRLAKDLFELFQILDEVDSNIQEISEQLLLFVKEQQVGMKVHYIHSAGRRMESFINICDQFGKWLCKHQKIIKTINIFSDKTVYFLNRIERMDMQSTEEIRQNFGYYSIGKDNIEVNLDIGMLSIRNALQATRSPDPSQFPSRDEVIKIIDQFAELSHLIKEAETSLRDFAKINLTVEDFFRN